VGRTATAWVSKGCEERVRERKGVRGGRESSCREEQGLGRGFIEEREGEEGSVGVGRTAAKVFKANDGIHGA
jgi:hypothetical protein